jgi:DNA-binding LytR/AlgR family response regulator
MAIKLLEAFVDKISYLELMESFDDASDALNFLESHEIDILFTDIQMPEINGLEMVRSLPNPPVTIFVSAHRDFAAEGFETDAIDYLIKPVTFHRFQKAVNKARDFINLRLEAQKKSATNDPFLFIKSDNGYIRVLLEEIIYFLAKGDYVSVITREQKKLLWRITMAEIENKVHSSHFMRVHKSYIININYIVSVHAGYINMVDNIEIPLSKSYKPRLAQRIGIG